MSEWVELKLSKFAPPESAFEMKFNRVYRLVILCDHIHYRNQWVMNLHPHLANVTQLNMNNSIPVEQVKEVALRLAIDLLQKRARETQSALSKAQAALDAAEGASNG